MKHKKLLGISLILAIVHVLVGFTILLVSSWFIAASAIAGMGFNYMLPAVVIRGLAILRIASGYFNMLFGHHHLLNSLADIRLSIFQSLADKHVIKRDVSLNALAYQSEEVASIWIAWVGQNAGVFLSISILMCCAVVFTPLLTWPLIVFLLVFSAIYVALVLSTLSYAAKLAKYQKAAQLSLIQHIESAPIWHMQNQLQPPKLTQIRSLQNRMQSNTRLAALFTSITSISTLCFILVNHAGAHLGNSLFVIIPMALLSVNDWLGRSIESQNKLATYHIANKSLTTLQQDAVSIYRHDTEVQILTVSHFEAQNTHMPEVSATFSPASLSLIVGSSGAGKSRFLQAIAGLIPSQGSRQVNQIEVPSGLLNDSLYIEQFPYCLSDTLKSNLLIANPNASDTHLMDVLKQVGLGYMTDINQWIGENGRRFSGGERKRLGLARALLSQANLILIDEPFEALDETNIEIACKHINQLSQHKIVLVASHIIPRQLKIDQQISLDPKVQPELSKEGIIHHE
ncbi:ATP-binding cassette domain-containing protein [Aliiglaciecola sp. 3_MG-2023]|uniref:ATP-binding cassette domain-containing protein n=1 Tax=Aliiglaciecola sp. 3_MG-2023 TaxID=3062644 RepID=UPI0026E3D3C9|nr:ATP-binding cassette domain-containing protein [Aliiglaciecola sp. 3_MG-2023]MDO6694471.1 ATP-binding cassette domain-containing protein [Aliiglaciecola sp. 3_MG-2023]